MQNSTNRIRVKVCGMTRADDVRAAVNLGVDAIGMILHADSPRTISVEHAKSLRAEVPALVSLVGVFVDCPNDTIDHYAAEIGLDLIQLHGDETNEVGAALGTPFIKAIRARNAEQVQADAKRYPGARALLLDPYVEGQHGGTGQSLDLSLWPTGLKQRLILAGGLSPDNIAQRSAAAAPFAVDLNSGVESAPGIKDSDLIAQAIAALASKRSN